MQVDALAIDGAFRFTPKLFGDERGAFSEQFKAPIVREAIGHDFELAQVNCSSSTPGVVRGIHYADVPPSQAKYVTCLKGSILDVIVDIRVGSPTFGNWTSVELDEESRKSVYLSEGLGHAFMALTDCTVMYLCNEVYTPGREHELHPLDPAIGIQWPDLGPVNLSPKDAAAPTLAEAAAAGLLPTHEACIAFQSELNAR
ncbi:MAG: dTDP-4-dehydrorhamnose 3,5-epimerase [Candidatus Nanopelagicales bacterium]